MVKKDIVSKWTTVRIREEMYDEIEKILHDPIVKKQGISSISQFVTGAIAKNLEELEKKRFDHVNMYEDHVKILDNDIGKMGRIVSVYFKKEGNDSWCEYCEESECVHVQYAWEIPEVRPILEKHGLKQPK